MAYFSLAQEIFLLVGGVLFYSMKEGFFMFGKKKKVKGNFISTCDARLIVEMLCAY